MCAALLVNHIKTTIHIYQEVNGVRFAIKSTAKVSHSPHLYLFISILAQKIKKLDKNSSKDVFRSALKVCNTHTRTDW